MLHTLNRRSFVTGLTGVAAGLIPSPASAEPPPETTSVRLPQWEGSAYCWAAPYIAGELLRAEGFTDVRYVQADPKTDQSVWIAKGETDFSVNYAPVHLASIESGVSIKVLAGLHSGCLELIANDSVQSIMGLRGKRVGVFTLDSSSYVLIALMAAYVGLDPVKDIQWVANEDGGEELFVNGKVDAFLGSPPHTQKLRAKKIGHTILNTTTDRPWSQQYCCMVSATADYVNRYPVAAKRVLRAIVKAADLCVSDPQLVARQMVDRGFARDYDYALQTLKDIRYDRWRDYDGEASLLFYALRMHEIGMIKKNPQDIIAAGTDWRFINDLKRELKT